MIRHLAGVYEVVEDVGAATRFYRDVLGIAVEYEPGGTYAHACVSGVLHFGIWDRTAAAEAVFGKGANRERVALGFSVCFEVADVTTAAMRLRSRGLTLSQEPTREHRGQAASHFFLPSGVLGAVTETPWAREIMSDVRVRAINAGQSALYVPSVCPGR